MLTTVAQGSIGRRYREYDPNQDLLTREVVEVIIPAVPDAAHQRPGHSGRPGRMNGTSTSGCRASAAAGRRPAPIACAHPLVACPEWRLPRLGAGPPIPANRQPDGTV